MYISELPKVFAVALVESKVPAYAPARPLLLPEPITPFSKPAFFFIKMCLIHIFHSRVI